MFRKQSIATKQAQSSTDVYIWHDEYHYSGHGAVSRFYFTERLELGAYRDRIVPRLSLVPGVMSDNGIRHHPYYLTVQWSSRLHGQDPYDELLERVENTTLEVLSEVFDWFAPEIERLSGHNEVLRTADRLRVDWRRGTF